MEFRRLGHRRIIKIMNRKQTRFKRKIHRNYFWKERMKERLQLKRELSNLHLKVEYAWSEEIFLDRIKNFCDSTDVLMIHRMGTMFCGETERQKSDELQSRLKDVRLNLAMSGFYVNTDHCIHRNLHTDCIFLTNKDPDMPIVIDTGASISLTPNKDDFISFESAGNRVSTLENL